MILYARADPCTFGKVWFGSRVVLPVCVDSVLVSDRVLSDTVCVPTDAFCTVNRPDAVEPTDLVRSS